jgi:hypothetical protein
MPSIAFMTCPRSRRRALDRRQPAPRDLGVYARQHPCPHVRRHLGDLAIQGEERPQVERHGRHAALGDTPIARRHPHRGGLQPLLRRGEPLVAGGERDPQLSDDVRHLDPVDVHGDHHPVIEIELLHQPV